MSDTGAVQESRPIFTGWRILIGLSALQLVSGIVGVFRDPGDLAIWDLRVSRPLVYWSYMAVEPVVFAVALTALLLLKKTPLRGFYGRLWAPFRAALAAASAYILLFVLPFLFMVRWYWLGDTMQQFAGSSVSAVSHGSYSPFYETYFFYPCLSLVFTSIPLCLLLDWIPLLDYSNPSTAPIAFPLVHSIEGIVQFGIFGFLFGLARWDRMRQKRRRVEQSL